jgi:hypothetical protein
MKSDLLPILLVGLLLPLSDSSAAEESVDFNKAREYFQRQKRGETLSPNKQSYLDRAKELRAAHSQGISGGSNLAYNDPHSQELIAKRQQGTKLSEEERLYLNPKLKAVDCAQGAQTAAKISDPNWPYWKLVQQRLADAQVTPQQVKWSGSRKPTALPKNRSLPKPGGFSTTCSRT